MKLQNFLHTMQKSKNKQCIAKKEKKLNKKINKRNNMVTHQKTSAGLKHGR